MKKTIILLVALGAMLGAGSAWAQQCKTDMDCEGDLVCQGGACKPPAPIAAEPAPVAAAPASDTCASISCSNHGTCVMAGDRPACSCDEGYQPDATTGLSCLPLTPAPAAAPVPVAPVSTEPDRNDPELVAVETALGASRYYQFVSYKRNLRINSRMSYAEYEYNMAKSKRNSGIATLACFPIPLGVGLGMFFGLGSIGGGAFVAGSVFLGIGSAGAFTMIIVGAAKTGKYSGRMRRIAPLVQGKSAALELEGVGPLLALDGAPAGLSLAFGF